MTPAQRRRRDRAIVAAAARSACDARGRPCPLPYALIGRALGLSGQRVKELVAELDAETASKTAGDDFAAPSGPARLYGTPGRRRKLRPVRD